MTWHQDEQRQPYGPDDARRLRSRVRHHAAAAPHASHRDGENIKDKHCSDEERRREGEHVACRAPRRRGRVSLPRRAHGGAPTCCTQLCHEHVDADGHVDEEVEEAEPDRVEVLLCSRRVQVANLDARRALGCGNARGLWVEGPWLVTPCLVGLKAVAVQGWRQLERFRPLDRQSKVLVKARSEHVTTQPVEEQ